MKCFCASVDDGEGHVVPKLCTIHEAAPQLFRALTDLVTAIHERREGFVIERQGMPMEQIVEAALDHASKLVTRLGPLYYETPRGIRGLRDASDPPSDR